jgi:uncharacterized membrane protein
MNWIELQARCMPLLATFFFAASALWMGTLFSVSWLSGRAKMMADGPEIGSLAVSLYRRWATPSMLVSMGAGVGWLAEAPSEGLRAHWVYGIVAAVLALVGLHNAVGGRARRVGRGSLNATRGEGVRRLALLVSFGAIVALASLRGSLLP